MDKLQGFRKQNPDYNDVEDNELADMIYHKYYSDLPKEQFFSDLGLGLGGGASDVGTPSDEESMPWSDVGIQAALNAPASTYQVLDDTWEAITHPIKTAKSLYGLGKGIIEIAREGDQGADEQQARAVGKFFSDRYFGMENLKRTLAKDPAGFLADVSMLLTGGGAAVARMPGMAGTAGRAVAKYARRADPVDLAVRTGIGATKAGGKGLAAGLGMLTGSGGEQITRAYKSGTRAFPGSSSDFVREIRKKYDKSKGEDMSGVVSDLKKELAKKVSEKDKSYQRLEETWKNSDVQLDIGPIMEKYQKLKIERLQDRGVPIVGSKKLKVLEGTGKPKKGGVDQILTEFMENPQNHDPRGFDALKKSLNELDLDFEKNRVVHGIVADIKKAITDEIKAKVPGYAEAMDSHAKKAAEVKILEKEFSLGHKNTPPQALRKLHSAMKQNATSSFGYQYDLLKELDPSGKVRDKLSGQILHSLEPPRGRGGMSPRTWGNMGMGMAAGTGIMHPTWLALLGLQSPRIAGELAYKAGQLTGLGGVVPKIGGLLKMTPEKASVAAHGLFQAGRQERVKKEPVTTITIRKAYQKKKEKEKQTKGKIKRKGK